MNAASTMMKDQSTVQVFLSYATPDLPYARQLRTLLSQRANLRVFTTDTLSAGEDWPSRLREEIAKSDVFVLLLSPASVDSKWVLQELGAAWALNKPIIPVATQPEVSARIPVELSAAPLVDIKSLENPEVIHQLFAPFEQQDSAGGADRDTLVE